MTDVGSYVGSASSTWAPRYVFAALTHTHTLGCRERFIHMGSEVRLCRFNTHTHRHTHTLTQTHTDTHRHRHRHRHTQTQTHTHTHTHTYTHTHPPTHPRTHPPTHTSRERFMHMCSELRLCRFKLHMFFFFGVWNMPPSFSFLGAGG